MNQTNRINQTSFQVLIALGSIHCLNDTLQGIVAASYPILKNDMALNFTQIGWITLVYQFAASVFQPFIGFAFDKRPFVWALPIGMLFTVTGLISLAFAASLPIVFCSVFLVGIGSATLHPEASRLTGLASGEKRGLAQSFFQVGGNLGSSLGPLLVSLLIASNRRQDIAYFSIIAIVAILIMIPLCQWYKKRLRLIQEMKMNVTIHAVPPLPIGKTIFSLIILLLLIFSKYIYMASLTNYYTFYLIKKFGVEIETSQILLFVFLFATALGTLIGGLIGDKIGRKYVIWISIFGAAPFALGMPYVDLFWTIIMSFCTGLILSSAFPAIVIYAQELVPNKLGLISGLFFGFAFGVAGIASAVLGRMADNYGIEAVYRVCAWMPLIGLITVFLPNLKRVRDDF